MVDVAAAIVVDRGAVFLRHFVQVLREECIDTKLRKRLAERRFGRVKSGREDGCGWRWCVYLGHRIRPERGQDFVQLLCVPGMVPQMVD